jgi:uncharacterized membrane protein YeaQ/YmgE (transglycosylase-associated protein family)
MERIFVKHDTPYNTGNCYTPLTSLVFAPLMWAQFETGYRVLGGLTLVSFLLAALILPLALSPPPGARSMCLLLFVTGLSSYGLQFELERGQFNVLAFCLSTLAVFLFHWRPRLRLLAYLLFSLAVQLKLFPAIFIVMLVDSWGDWLANVKRAIGLGAFNFALLFCLGLKSFTDFIAAIMGPMLDPVSWVGNHSIKSYVNASTADGQHLVPPGVSSFMRENATVVLLALLGFVVACLGLIVFRAIRRKARGFNPHLFLACTIGALVIPSVSHDYKLALLGGPMAVAFNSFSASTRGRRWSVFSPLVVIAALAYASTLYSFVYKESFLQNNFPALLVILAAFTALAFLSDARGVGSAGGG